MNRDYVMKVSQNDINIYEACLNLTCGYCSKEKQRKCEAVELLRLRQEDYIGITAQEFNPSE